MLIPIDLIVPGTRLRGTTAAIVAILADSIKAVGLLSPITVRPSQVIQASIFVDGYGLIAGLHRLEACRQLGMTEIEAHVVSLGELERQIAECDENLCGTKLTAAERALFVRRRKQAYEALHPETRNGAKGNGRPKLSQLEKPTFVDDTAAKTGQGRSTIARDAARGAKVDEAVLVDIKGTALDTGRTLDALARVPKDSQAAELARLQQAAPIPLVKPLAAPLEEAVALDKWGEPARYVSLQLLPDEIELLLADHLHAVKVYRPTKRKPPANEHEARYYGFHQERAAIFRAAYALVAPASDDDASEDLVDQATGA